MGEPPRDVRVIEPYRGAYRWEGWGTCLSWWANTELGTRDDLTAAFFGRGQARVAVDGAPDADLPGLGLNVVRYNLGACTFAEVDGRRMTVSPHIPRRKQVEGFWDGGERWNKDADGNQRTALAKARAAGVDTVELASVSPLWWMTATGDPCGAAEPGTDNLRPAGHAGHAAYLAAAARTAYDDWGARVASVEPFNEPTAGWWVAGGKQEGCHFSSGAQADVLRLLRAELDRRGLRDVPIAASDEYAFDQATATWTGLPGAAARLVGRVNVHGYQAGPDDPGPRRRLRAALGDMPLWQSEYGDGDATGLTMARNISADLNDLRPLAWVLWQPVEHSGWGLLDGRFDPPADAVTATDHGTLAASVGGVRPAYHVFAQYTRHIRPNVRVLDGGHRSTVAGYDEDRGRLALVTVNPADAPSEVTYDLGRFRRAGDAARTWTTDTAAGRRYAPGTVPAPSGGRLTVRHDPKTVTTIEIDGVER